MGRRKTSHGAKGDAFSHVEEGQVYPQPWYGQNSAALQLHDEPLLISGYGIAADRHSRTSNMPRMPPTSTSANDQFMGSGAIISHQDRIISQMPTEAIESTLISTRNRASYQALLPAPALQPTESPPPPILASVAPLTNAVNQIPYRPLATIQLDSHPDSHDSQQTGSSEPPSASRSRHNRPEPNHGNSLTAQTQTVDENQASDSLPVAVRERVSIEQIGGSRKQKKARKKVKPIAQAVQSSTLPEDQPKVSPRLAKLDAETPSKSKPTQSCHKQIEVREQRKPYAHTMPRPHPTTTYLQIANRVPETLATKRSLLVVLDLNGTLLHRRQRGGHSFIHRPGVEMFIEYLFKQHHVMVWSSARPANVDKMCAQLLDKEQDNNIVAIWARDRLRLSPEQYDQRVQVYKRLAWIWADPGIQTVCERRACDSWSQTDTILIDDSAEKAAGEPFNLIQIEEFENRPDQRKPEVLQQVINYLEILRLQRNVSSYIREHAFSYQPV